MLDSVIPRHSSCSLNSFAVAKYSPYKKETVLVGWSYHLKLGRVCVCCGRGGVTPAVNVFWDYHHQSWYSLSCRLEVATLGLICGEGGSPQPKLQY